MVGFPWSRPIEVEGRSVTAEAYFLEHAGERTVAEWAAFLGRSEPAVYSKANRHGVTCKPVEMPAAAAAPAGPHPPPAKRYRDIDPQAVIRALRGKPLTLEELSRALDRSAETVRAVIAEMQADGYVIGEDEGVVQELPPVTQGEGPPPATLADRQAEEIAFAVVSDTHGGDKAAQWTNLAAFVRIAREEFGVRHILHAGDLTTGNGRVYVGQQYDLYAHGVEDQVDDAVHNLPQYPGLDWWILSGNHDWSFFKTDHLDIVKLICDKRDDLHYLGAQSADIPITEASKARLWHPRGGVPYAISYRGQKYAAELSFSEMANVLKGRVFADAKDDLDGYARQALIRFVFIGHLHVMMCFQRGPLAVFQSGCFQGQTGYLAEHGLFPQIGGWIIVVRLTREGAIQRLLPYWQPFEEIEEDYKHHYVPHMAKRKEIVPQPLFYFEGS